MTWVGLYTNMVNPAFKLVTRARFHLPAPCRTDTDPLCGDRLTGWFVLRRPRRAWPPRGAAGRWLQKASRSASSSLNRALGPAETLEPAGSGERCLYRRRAPEFTEVGAGLSRWPNALRALGVGGEVRSRAAAVAGSRKWPRAPAARCQRAPPPAPHAGVSTSFSNPYPGVRTLPGVILI